jgi:hypothetical protein
VPDSSRRECTAIERGESLTERTVLDAVRRVLGSVVVEEGCLGVPACARTFEALHHVRTTFVVGDVAVLLGALDRVVVCVRDFPLRGTHQHPEHEGQHQSERTAHCLLEHTVASNAFQGAFGAASSITSGPVDVLV